MNALFGLTIKVFLTLLQAQCALGQDDGDCPKGSHGFVGAGE